MRSAAWTWIVRFRLVYSLTLGENKPKGQNRIKASKRWPFYAASKPPLMSREALEVEPLPRRVPHDPGISRSAQKHQLYPAEQ